MIELKRSAWCDNPTDEFTTEDHDAMKHAGVCFSKGGGGTNTIKQDIPQWMQDAGFANYSNAVNISQRPYEQSPNTVADFNQTNYDVFNRVNDLQGSTTPGYNAALGVTGNVAGYQANQANSNNNMQTVSGGQVAGNSAAIAGAMNPYLNQVESYGLNALDQQRLAGLNSNADQAFQVGGQFGSRAAVQNGVTNANAAKAAGELSSNLRAQAYDSATGLLTSDAARSLAAQQSNQSTNLSTQQLNQQGQIANQAANQSAAALRLQAGQQIGTLTGQQLDASGKEISLLDNVAAQQRAQQQAILDQNANWFTQSYNYPIEMQNLRQSALGLAPYATTQTTTNTGGGNIVGQAAGGAMLGGSIAGAMGASSGWGALAGAGLGAVASDPDLKTAVRREGTDEETGLGIFSWDYKDDPDSAPRRLGLMASGPGGVRSNLPEAYTEAGGTEGILTSKLPPRLRQIAANDAAPAAAPRARRKGGR